MTDARQARPWLGNVLTQHERALRPSPGHGRVRSSRGEGAVTRREDRVTRGRGHRALAVHRSTMPRNATPRSGPRSSGAVCLWAWSNRTVPCRARVVPCRAAPACSARLSFVTVRGRSQDDRALCPGRHIRPVAVPLMHGPGLETHMRGIGYRP